MTQSPGGPRAGDPPVRLEVVVQGRVQAVGFRVFVASTASGLGLAGWVANLPGGSVRCVAEGPRPSLEILLERLRKGPPGSRVDGVFPAWAVALGGFDGFRIRSHAHPGD